MKLHNKFMRKTTSLFISFGIFAILLWPVFKANKIFSRNNDERTHEPEEQRPVKVDEEKDKQLSEKGISLPKAIVFEKPKKNTYAANEVKKDEVTSQNVQPPENQVPQKMEKPSDRIVHEPVKSMSTRSKPPENKEAKKSAIAAHTETNKTVPEETDTNKPAETFNIESYKKDLIERAGLKDGERTPLILFDDMYYKEGLSYYGYQLVARPNLLPKEPYYFVISESEIKLVRERSPYVGTFPPATEEDVLHFRELLSKSSYCEMTKDCQFQVFYAPMDMQMQQLMKCKLKIILDSFHEKMDEIVKAQSKFKKIGNEYILTIESFQKMNGQTVIVNDPDNQNVASAG